MRVIAGQFKSRMLRTLRGMALRPTGDRLRETLFNILGAAVEGSVFVDLFAGTGAIGIEALSRSAVRVIFIESHAAAVKLIRENLKSLGVNALIRESGGLPRRLKPHTIPAAYSTAKAVPLQNAGAYQQTASGEAEILAMDAIRGLKQLTSNNMRADFIFLDPPYACADEYERVLEFIDSANLLAHNGILIAEHAKKINLPERMHSLERTRVLVQCDSALSFYRTIGD